MENINRLIRLCSIVFILFATNVHAQLELYASQVTVTEAEQVQINLTAANVDDLVSLQFTLEWDPAVINLAGVDNLGLPQMRVEDIGLEQAASGSLVMAWLDNSLEGVNLPDSTVIFSITYDVIGMPGDTSAIEFTGNIAIIEAINSNTQEVEVQISPGKVTIMDEISNVATVSESIFAVQPNFPNPFSESTIISANFAAPTVGTLRIFTTNGEEIYTHQQRYSAGEHSLFIAQDLFPEAGTYWYQLQTMTHSITKPLIVIK